LTVALPPRLRLQVMDPADAEKFYFDPLDCTKVRELKIFRS
jgi:catalase